MWTKFSKVYQHPWDIELFPGAMSEKLVEGGILGPTFACIIGEQFRRLLYGDRCGKMLKIPVRRICVLLIDDSVMSSYLIGRKNDNACVDGV